LSRATVRNVEMGRGSMVSVDAVLRALELRLHVGYRNIGEPQQVLAFLRKEYRLSRSSVAKEMGISRNTLARLDRGEPGRLETLETYARAIDADIFITRRDEVPTPPRAHRNKMRRIWSPAS
jgi:DNA-binding XRE family transcriptional regulator